VSVSFGDVSGCLDSCPPLFNTRETSCSSLYTKSMPDTQGWFGPPNRTSHLSLSSPRDRLFPLCPQERPGGIFYVVRRYFPHGINRVGAAPHWLPRSCLAKLCPPHGINRVGPPQLRAMSTPRLSGSPRALSRLPASATQRLSDSATQRLSDSASQRLSVSALPCFRASALPCFRASVLPCFRASELPRFRASVLPRFHASALPRFRARTYKTAATVPLRTVTAVLPLATPTLRSVAGRIFVARSAVFGLSVFGAGGVFKL